MDLVPSLQSIAGIQTAIQVLHHPCIKDEVFCVRESEFYTKQKRNACLHDPEYLWFHLIELKASKAMDHLSLTIHAQEIAVKFLERIAKRMLFWAKYHETKFGLSRKYIMDVSHICNFDEKGLIDYKKAAKTIVADTSLSLQKRFKLACHYCIEDDIASLFIQIRKKKKEKSKISESLQDVNRSGLEIFWSCHLECEKEKGQDFYSIGLDRAIDVCSKVAVEYFVKELSIENKNKILVDAARKTVSCIMNCQEHYFLKNYYTDILCFIFSEMEINEKMEFIRRDIEINGCKILISFLQRPYQDYFLEAVNLIWEILPENAYAQILLKIAHYVARDTDKYLNIHSEVKYYDYRDLLSEFWCRSPEKYKNYILNNSIVNECSQRIITQLLFKLFQVENLTSNDKQNIHRIISAYTNEEKENIVSCFQTNIICFKLAKEQKWKTLDEFIVNCLSTEEKIQNLKRKFCLSSDGTNLTKYFLENENYTAAETFLKWSTLSVEKIIELKNDILHQISVKSYILKILLDDRNSEGAERIIRWLLSSQQEIFTFKRELLFGKRAISKCANQIANDTSRYTEYIEKYLQCNMIFSDEVIIEFKEKLAYEKGIWICKKLICQNKWLEIEIFLTWCFSSEEAITLFKRKCFYKYIITDIHFRLINNNDWGIAETLFAWLGLSSSDTENIKKETLLNCKPAQKMFHHLLFCVNESGVSSKCGSLERAGLILRWCLRDKASVVEFKKDFRKRQGIAENKVILKEFKRLIKQRLRDLDEEQNFK